MPTNTTTFHTRCIWEWLQWLSFTIDGYNLFVEVVWHVQGENFVAKTGEKVHMRQFLYTNFTLHFINMADGNWGQIHSSPTKMYTLCVNEKNKSKQS